MTVREMVGSPLSLTRGMLHQVTSCSEFMAACFLGFTIFYFSANLKFLKEAFLSVGDEALLPEGPPNTAFAFQPVMSPVRHAQVRATKTVSSVKWAGHAWRMPVWVRSIQ